MCTCDSESSSIHSVYTRVEKLSVYRIHALNRFMKKKKKNSFTLE